jgi:transcriptional regulator with XRE-family HTH domain
MNETSNTPAENPAETTIDTSVDTALDTGAEVTSNDDWYSPDQATFGDRLAAAREQTGMTQGALAKRLGVRLPTLRAWENDMSEPRANRLSMLAGLLNVSIMWLINGEGEGVDGPESDSMASAELSDILGEVRFLRTDMHKKAEQMGRLEKRMRRMMENATND